MDASSLPTKKQTLRLRSHSGQKWLKSDFLHSHDSNVIKATATARVAAPSIAARRAGTHLKCRPLHQYEASCLLPTGSTNVTCRYEQHVRDMTVKRLKHSKAFRFCTQPSSSSVSFISSCLAGPPTPLWLSAGSPRAGRRLHADSPVFRGSRLRVEKQD